MVSPKGGAGKTAVSSNLSVALAQRHPGRVAAVDLDVQFGDLALALSLTPEQTLGASSLDRARSTRPRSNCTSTSGAARPVRPRRSDRPRRRRLDQPRARVAGAADAGAELRLRRSSTRRRASTSSRSPRWNAPPTCYSSRASTSRASAVLRKALDAFDHIGITAERRLILNRADSKVGLDPSDAEDAMGMKIACSIPSSREIPLSLNLGTPVVISEPKSAVAQADCNSCRTALRTERSPEPLERDGGDERQRTHQSGPGRSAPARRGQRTRWREARTKTVHDRRVGRLQGHRPRGTVRAARNPTLRGDERGPDALARDDRDQLADGRAGVGVVAPRNANSSSRTSPAT